MLAPTCFGSRRNHHQGAGLCLDKSTNMYRRSQCYDGVSACCAARAAHSQYSALIVWALWKIINVEDAVLIPKIRGENFTNRFLHSEFFLGEGGEGGSRYAGIPLIVALSPGYSDITRFRPWSPIATGNHLDRAEKIPKVVQMIGTVDVFYPRSEISGLTSRTAFACPNLHERWTQPARVRCPVAHLLI